MRRLIGACLAVLALAPGLAAAEAGGGVEGARGHDERGAELYSAGDYAGALEQMRAAHALVPATARLYNMARCEEELGETEAALELYRQFIAAEDAPPDRRSRALERVEALSATADPAPPPEEPPPGDEPRPVDPTPAAPAPALGPTPFYAMLGVTAASAVALAIVGGYALALQQEFDGLQREDARAYELEEEGPPWTLGANVLIGVTAAAAATTLLLALFTRFGDAGPAIPVSSGGPGRDLALSWSF